MRKHRSKIHLNRETLRSLESSLVLRAAVGASVEDGCTFDGCTTSVNDPSGHPGCSNAQCTSLVGC